MFGTKLVVSLPLFTADPDVNNYVTDLRNALNEFVDWFKETNPPQPLHVRKLWGNPNDNLWKNGELIKDYYSNDGIHLTDTGRRTILANFRHTHVQSPQQTHETRREFNQLQQLKVSTLFFLNAII